MFQYLHTFNENLPEYLNSLSINPDKSLLAACFHDSVKVWDLTIGEIVHTINLSGDQYGHTNTLVSPDWRTIISDDRYGNLRIYDFWTGYEIKSIQSSSSALAFTPDGKFLFEGICKPPFTKDGEIEVHITDVLTGQLRCVLPFLKGYLPIRSLLVSPDGNILVFQASHLLTQVWDWQNRQCLQTFNALPSSSPLSSPNPVCRHWIDTVATCPNGRIIAAVAQWDKSIEGTTNAIWDMQTTEILCTLGVSQREPTEGNPHSAMTSDGSLLAIGNLNEIEVWNLNSKKCFCLLRGHKARIAHLIISSDGKVIVSYASNDSIKVWNTSLELP